MAEQAAEPARCEHAWSSKHVPGHRLYWINQCMLCHEVDWDDLDAQISELMAVHEVVFLPAGTVIDGAVVELAQHPDGLITADVRIPAHQP